MGGVHCVQSWVLVGGRDVSLWKIETLRKEDSSFVGVRAVYGSLGATQCAYYYYY